MSMHHRWRFIDYSSKNPAINLAIEEALIREVLEDRSPNTLRLWQNPPTVVIGCFQDPRSVVNIEACERMGISIIRRVSGGGAVYHDRSNLNYSLIIHKRSLAFLEDIIKSYSGFCSGVIEGLRILGVNAYARKGNIMVDGKKISGSAQYRLYDTVLHHGTLMVNVNLNKLERALGVFNQEKCLTNLRNVLHQRVSLDKIKRAISMGFEKRFNVKFERGGLTPNEERMAKMLYEIKYSKRDWNIGTYA